MNDLTSKSVQASELFNPMSLTGRTIMVTGASSGIGQATAIYLSKLGARLIVTGRDEVRLQATLDALSGADHAGRVMDLAQSERIVPWMKDTCATYGPLDGLVHCAGIQSMRPLQMVSIDYVHEVVNANLVAAIALAQAFRLKACHNPGAALVLVSSTAALKGAAGNSVYAASKGAIISLTRSLGLELLRDKIRVNAVAPGLVDTPIADAFREATEAGYQKVIEAQPLGIGQPEDVAAAIAFLLADTSRWISGSTMAVDGGLLT